MYYPINQTFVYKVLTSGIPWTTHLGPTNTTIPQGNETLTYGLEIHLDSTHQKTIFHLRHLFNNRYIVRTEHRFITHDGRKLCKVCAFISAELIAIPHGFTVRTESILQPLMPRQ